MINKITASIWISTNIHVLVLCYQQRAIQIALQHELIKMSLLAFDHLLDKGILRNC